MIYRVYLDGVNIYDMSEGMELVSGSANVELNSAGSCDITMPSNHVFYDAVMPMRSELDIFEGDKIVWSGRVTDYVIDWNNNKKISAEGDLAFLNDVILRQGHHMPTSVWQDQPVSTFFTDIITAYNNNVALSKQFTIGHIDPKFAVILVTRTVNYARVMDVIQEQCIDAVGGYVFTRKEWDETTQKYIRYIDWYKDIPYNGSQPVQFALNLLDLNQNFVGTDIITSVIPLGDDGEGNKITVESIDDPQSPEGSDEVITDATEETGVDPETGEPILTPVVDLYGKITEVIEFNDVPNPIALLRQAKDYLKNKQFDHLSIECNVAELKYLYPNLDAFEIGQLVDVYSTPHRISKKLAISKVNYDIVKASKNITIGTPPRQDLSEITGSGSTGSADVTISGGSGGGGGGGGGGGSVVSVVPIITTGDSIALIYVNGTPYTLKYDTSGLSARIDSKADASNVYSKSEMNTALALKANVEDVYDRTETYSKDDADETFATIEDTYDKDFIDETVINLQTQIDGKADAVDIDDINLRIHEAKFKFMDFYNKSTITLGSTTSVTESTLKIFDQDFVMDSVSPLCIEAEILFSSVMVAYKEQRSLLYNTPVLTIYDPPIISLEIVLDNQTLDFNPKQVLDPEKNTWFIKREISSIDRQMHNVKFYLTVKGGKVTINKNEMQILLSGTGLDAEGFSGVAIGADDVSLFNITYSNMFNGIADSEEERTMTPIPQGKVFTDNVVFPNFYSGFLGFTEEVTEITTEEPEENEGG